MKMGRYFAAFAIAINYFQILFIFRSIIMNWSDGVIQMFEYLSIFSFNLELAKPECMNPSINYFFKGELMFLIPPMLFVGMLIVCILSVPPFSYPYLFLKKLIKRSNEDLPPITLEKLVNRFFNATKAFHVLLQFMYVSLCTWALGFYNCNAVESKYAMAKEPSIFCYEGIHAANEPYFVAALVLYVIGLPIYFSTLYIILYQTRYKHPMLLSMKKGVERLLLSGASIYKPSTQFVVSAQLLMKLSILLVQNFISDSVPTQAVVIQLALFTYIGFLIYFKPYSEKDHTIADIFCQICSTLTIACGILFYTNKPTNSSTVEQKKITDRVNSLTAIVITITTCCVVAACIFVARDIHRGGKVLKVKIAEDKEKRKSIQDEKERMKTLKRQTMSMQKTSAF